jgi:hypothetical protein
MSLVEELTLQERKKHCRDSRSHKRKQGNLDGIERSQTTLLRLQGHKDIYYILYPLNIQTILFTMAKAQFKGAEKGCFTLPDNIKKNQARA